MHAYLDNDKNLVVQKAPYIEDGWYIQHIEGQWELWDIPQCGGQPQFIKSSLDFNDVYNVIETLT